MANPGYYDPKKKKFVITSPNIDKDVAEAALKKVAPAATLDYQPVYTATNENNNVVHTGITPYMEAEKPKEWVGEPGTGEAAMLPKPETQAQNTQAAGNAAAQGSRPSYTPQYQGYIDQILSGALDYGDYQSPYAGQINSALRGVTQYGPYQSEYHGRIDRALGNIENYGDYVSPYSERIDSAMNEMLNRDPFSYDYTQDPAWQAYKKQYTREGRRASEDTLGQYAAMTGGMPSTAAMTAASQAGDYYAAQMADKIPELYKLAYSMYADDANRQLQNLNALRALDNDQYGRYNDTYGRMLSGLSALQGQDATEYGRYADQYNRNLSALPALEGLDATEYARYGDRYNRIMNNLAAVQGLDSTDYGRYRDAVGDWNAERNYADARADLAYNRAWNEDERAYERAWNEEERDRKLAKEDEANTIYGYGSDGSSYKITSQLGRDFISNARYGDPDMTGGDGSIWHKNEDGTVTITRKDGRSYTVSGTPAEWNGLTLAQMWDAIDRANKTGTEIPPNVLKAWEHFMGGSYTGGAPTAVGGYTGGGYDLGGGNENPLAGFGLPAGKWREILGDAQGDKDKAMANLSYYWDVLTDEQRGILAQHAGFQSADLDRLGGASKIGLDVLKGYKDFYADPSAPYATEENEDTVADSNSFMTEKEWKKNKMGYDSYDDYVKAYREWLNS